MTMILFVCAVTNKATIGGLRHFTDVMLHALYWNATVYPLNSRRKEKPERLGNPHVDTHYRFVYWLWMNEAISASLETLSASHLLHAILNRRGFDIRSKKMSFIGSWPELWYLTWTWIFKHETVPVPSIGCRRSGLGIVDIWISSSLGICFMWLARFSFPIRSHCSSWHKAFYSI
jgi:hypothetical protein